MTCSSTTSRSRALPRTVPFSMTRESEFAVRTATNSRCQDVVRVGTCWSSAERGFHVNGADLTESMRLDAEELGRRIAAHPSGDATDLEKMEGKRDHVKIEHYRKLATYARSVVQAADSRKKEIGCVRGVRGARFRGHSKQGKRRRSRSECGEIDGSGGSTRDRRKEPRDERAGRRGAPGCIRVHQVKRAKQPVVRSATGRGEQPGLWSKRHV